MTLLIAHLVETNARLEVLERLVPSSASRAELADLRRDFTAQLRELDGA